MTLMDSFGNVVGRKPDGHEVLGEESVTRNLLKICCKENQKIGIVTRW